MKRIPACLLACLLLAGTPFASAQEQPDAIPLQTAGVTPPADAVLEYAFSVPASGSYSLTIEYQTIPYGNITPQAEASLDGGEAAVFDLPRIWTMAAGSLREDGRFARDSQGNELTPAHEEVTAPQTRTPLTYALAAGEHTLSLAMVRESVELRSVRLEPMREIQSYDAGRQPEPPDRDSLQPAVRVHRRLRAAQPGAAGHVGGLSYRALPAAKGRDAGGDRGVAPDLRNVPAAGRRHDVQRGHHENADDRRGVGGGVHGMDGPVREIRPAQIL